MRRASFAVFLAAGACATPPPAPPGPAVVTLPSTATPSPPTADAGDTTVAPPPAPPPAIAIVRRTKRFSAGGGWAKDAAYAAIAPLLPDVDACYAELLAREPTTHGVLTFGVRSEKGTLVRRVTGLTSDATFNRCVTTALGRFVAPPVVDPGGTPTVQLESEVYPAKTAPPLATAEPKATIRFAPDGSCSEVLHADCPANKVCAEDEARPVVCPAGTSKKP